MRKRLPAALLLLLVCAEIHGSTVSGRITVITRRGQKIVPAQTLVWLEPAHAAAPAKPASAVVTTRDKTLWPHVLAVPAGSTVVFPNEDPISHNLFSVTPPNPFDLGLYRRGPGKSQRFTRPGIVNVYCNVHPDMSAVIHVMNTPYYSFADGNGGFLIADVPPGAYKVYAWSEQAGTTQRDLQVSAKSDTTVALTLDSRGFRAARHLNKFGRPYQASSRAKDY